MKTMTIFRKRKEDGEIIALFPELNHESGDANRGMCQSYQHVGQHGEADYQHVIAQTVPADAIEYQDLAEELESLGYELDIRQRKPINVNI